MTAPTPHHPVPDPHDPATPPAAPVGAAELASAITDQLSSRLCTVRLHGFRRPTGTRPAPEATGTAPTLVAVAHGSRHPQAAPTVRALLARVRALRPGLPVHLGHIELDRPLLTDTLAGLRGEVVLVPLLLTRGHHVTRDLPAALAAAGHLTGRIAAPLGGHPLLAEALHGRLLEAGFPARPRARSAVVLAAAGSRAPRSAEDTARTARLLSARLGGIPVLPAFASAAAPTVPEAIRTLTTRGHAPGRIAVAACFTAPGRFADQCAATAPGPAAAPLGDHTALARLVLHRYDQALSARTGSGTEGIRAATVAV
ncbi:hypothetical protein GCM10010211_23120 [Streptomyces albospinus]|uniref:Sirohydrochlorin chelatase n=1 Tax=Streptomyces albospinus TaxID=285515 RepID=A0ABQ2UWL9_9ACTN|nr:sirohydrochlorin chelatase [Streptomyces albospinus]GGU57653.1 hypothetical protein GCM10010211_23120 [Streptomyces albospinus]